MFIKTAAKIAWREVKASPSKFLFVILAVAVGVGALSGVKGFGYAFKGMLLRNAKQLIAGDLQAQVWNLPTPEQLSHVDAIGVHYGVVTRVTETVSMAASATQRTPQLVSVKAVDPKLYPFYGSFKTEPNRTLAEMLTPERVVVTPELLIRMRTGVGGMLRLGGKDFQIGGTLVSEPDRLASGFGPGMRILMSREALERTGLIQFGSRAAQRFLFKLKPDANLEALRSDLKATLPRVFISDYREGDPAVGKSIDNATTFLSLVSLIALVIGSLGVAMAMYAHLQQRMDTIAVMKAVGARAGQVIEIYMLQTLGLSLVGGLLGVTVGALVQRAFPVLMQRLFALLPNVGWDWSFSLQGMSLGVLATLLLTLPPLMAIRHVKPNLVFRRDVAEPDTGRKRWRRLWPSIAGVIAILIGFGLIAVWLSDSVRMGAYFIAGLAVSCVLLMAAAALLLIGMRWLVRTLRLPATFRHGFANLYRPGNQARSVLVALGVGVMFTLTTYLLQKTILREVTTEGPGRTGNLILLDVRNSSGVTGLVERQPGVQGKVDLVGYLVARMLKKNGVDTDKLPITTERKNQLQITRLTTAEGKPDTLDIKLGAWWKPGTDVPQLAVSEEVVRNYGVGLNDSTEFQAAGANVTGQSSGRVPEVCTRPGAI